MRTIPGVLVGTVIGFTLNRFGYSDTACIAAMAAAQVVVVGLTLKFSPR